MALEISITQEGWQEIQDALQNPEKCSTEFLAKAIADFNHETFHGRGQWRPAQPHHRGAWDYKKLMKLPHNVLADTALECIRKVNTCNNGGNGYYIDWEGYHKLYT